MVIEPCFFCLNGCARCNFKGYKPPTERQVQEMVFRAEKVLATEKPDDAPVH